MNKLTYEELFTENWDESLIQYSLLKYIKNRIGIPTIETILDEESQYLFLGNYGKLYLKNFINIMLGDNPSTRKREGVRSQISKLVYNTYYDKWEKITNLFIERYDPLSPFDITLNEETTDNFTTLEDVYTKTGSSSTIDKDNITTDKTLTGKKESNFTGKKENDFTGKKESDYTENKENDKNTETEVLEDKVNSKQDTSIYGFNSYNAVPSDSVENSTEYSNKTQSSENNTEDKSSKNIEDTTSQNTEDTTSQDIEDTTDTITGTEKKDRTVTGTTTDTTSHLYSRENPKTREYTRKGNIGNISKQELFIKEIEKLKVLLLPIIFNDIVSLVCRNTFKED